MNRIALYMSKKTIIMHNPSDNIEPALSRISNPLIENLDDIYNKFAPYKNPTDNVAGLLQSKRNLILVCKTKSTLCKNESTVTDINMNGAVKIVGKSANEKDTTNTFFEKGYNSLSFSGWKATDVIVYKRKRKRIRIDTEQKGIHLEYVPSPIGSNRTTSYTIDKSSNIIVEKTRVNIDVKIENIGDLLKLIHEYPLKDGREYNINMESLHNIYIPLTELNDMIGLKNVKDNVVDQILYFVQGLHTNSGGDYMHTVIFGPPGTGKTEVAKLMGQIFSKLGILKKGTFKKVTRSDLVAGFLGQTAIKTRDVINECLGGVLFIDEAYALGNSEKRDSFSKECIDTLCEALSNHKSDLMVIIAGYEEELKDCFFSYNQGLESRFTWRFKTDDYKAEEIYKIFLKKVGDCGWSILDGSLIDVAWFEKRQVYFKYFGRDVETLLSKVKISHSRRVFCKPVEEKMKLTLADLEEGFKLYLKNDEVKNRKDGERKEYLMKTMYV